MTFTFLASVQERVIIGTMERTSVQQQQQQQQQQQEIVIAQVSVYNMEIIVAMFVQCLNCSVLSLDMNEGNIGTMVWRYWSLVM